MTRIHPVKLGFVTCYLLESDSSFILVDAGYPKKEDRLWKFLDSRQIDPRHIKLIIITHGHVDHVGSLKPIKEKTGAPVLIHESEAPLLSSGRTPGVAITLKWLSRFVKMENGTSVAPVDPDITISGEYPLNDYGITGKVIPTPGHTEGSLSVILDGENAIVGDIAMKFPILSRKSYEPIVARDLNQVYQSWQTLIDEGVRVIYPAHGKPIGIEVLQGLIEAKTRP
ncbi:MAG: MBL fold metallo-hydrolase [Desulfobacterales bacterium]